jgi:hypothetical protein
MTQLCSNDWCQFVRIVFKWNTHRDEICPQLDSRVVPWWCPCEGAAGVEQRWERERESGTEREKDRERERQRQGERERSKEEGMQRGREGEEGEQRLATRVSGQVRFSCAPDLEPRVEGRHTCPRQGVRNCDAGNLYQQRTQLVPGIGRGGTVTPPNGG